MSLEQWALPQLAELLPLDEESLKQIITYTNTLPDAQIAEHLRGLLGDSPQADEFITSFNTHRSVPAVAMSKEAGDNKLSEKGINSKDEELPAYAPPSHPLPSQRASRAVHRPHTNPVIEAGQVPKDAELATEASTADMWSRAVMYPEGEKAYNDNYQGLGTIFTYNPYRSRVTSPYGYYQSAWGPQRPRPDSHARSIHETIHVNNILNREAQASIDAKEPKINIWDDSELNGAMSNMTIATDGDQKRPVEKASSEKRQKITAHPSNENAETSTKPSKFTSFRKSIGIKSSEERAVAKTEGRITRGRELRNAILAEEQGRWPDEQWRQIVTIYQDKVGMTRKIAYLRTRQPIQYLHLLRAGYFEPIPVAWAGQTSNPLKFSIEGAAGWRGITPMWRGYEDTAEERLYWILNHREGSVGIRMKPDFISQMDMARARMASAVEPPPEYYSANDTCHIQHTSPGYSKQVMPAPFRAYDRPQLPTDDTMILLDISGSMDFDPLRPNYNQYLITGYSRSTQPKNKDVAKAIIRRFTNAMENHDHDFRGYSLTTFSSQADYMGMTNHQNLDATWRNIRFGGGTRVMTGWQMVKNLHFEKHSASAIHHPVYGWQAGPETPMLRLLLLLDGEATDMDEFELDLLGLSWAHVTIFLIGVDGCPHHHRHANELQRISDVNHHVSFVDAQGNTPERFVTHELLKRHLGYEISMSEFEHMEELPPYSVSV
ncbi:hypothetical protein B7463_g3566, partial [Scytalidium lignicola]